MNEKSNKVITVYVICFYLFAFGSFGIRSRWVLIATLFATTISAMVYGGFRCIRISKIRSYWMLLFITITLFVLLPNARHDADIYNFLIYVSISTYVVFIAKTNLAEVSKIKKIMIFMGVFLALYGSFFRLFPSIYSASIYKMLSSATKESYLNGIRFGYGLPIGNGYTFYDSALWLGITSAISNDLSDSRGRNNKVYITLMLIGMILEGRKGELLSAILAIFLMYHLGRNKSFYELIRRVFYCVLIIILGFIIIRFFASSGVLQRYTVFLERIIQSRRGETVDFSSGRLMLWMTAIDLFKRNPLLGIGWGKFANYSEGYYQAYVGGSVRNTHNVFLQLLCETGAIGTALIVIPYAYIVKLTLKNVNKYKSGTNNKTLFGNHIFSLGILLFSLMLSFLDPNLYGIYFWCMLVVACLVEEYSISTQELFACD